MNATLRSLLAGHRVRLAALVLAATAAALLGLAGCGPTAAKSTNDHACADLVARATTTTGPVSGLWNCLTQGFQNRLKEVGALADPSKTPDAVLSIGVALSTTLIGADANYAAYDLVLNPSSASQAGVSTVEVTVWLVGGKVDNVGVGSPAF